MNAKQTVMPLTMVLILSMTMFAERAVSAVSRGLVVEEVITGSSKRTVAVLRSEKGEYRLLTPEAVVSNDLTISAVDWNRMVVSRRDGTDVVELPVQHGALPLDVLTAAIVRSEGKQLVLAHVVPPEPIEYLPSSGDVMAELAVLWEAVGAELVIENDLVVIGRMSDESGNETSSHDCQSRELEHVRRSLEVLHGEFSDLLSALADRDDEQANYTVDGSTVEEAKGALKVTVSVTTLPTKVVVEKIARLTNVVFKIPSNIVTVERQQRAWKRVIALARQGRVARSRRLLAQLIRRVEPQARYFVAFFQLSWKLGDKKRAVVAIKRALELDGNNEYVRRVLEKLKAKRVRQREAA